MAMTWADFYLICFAVGFAFSFLSFLLGGVHWHLPFHIHVGGHGHIPHVHVGHAPAANSQTHGSTIAPINPMTLAAFLAWFGGTGYLLTRFSTIWFFFGMIWAIVAGLLGAAIIFFFMTRVLMS